MSDKTPLLIGLSQRTLDGLEEVRKAQAQWSKATLSSVVREALSMYVNNPQPPIKGQTGEGQADRLIPRTYWIDRDILHLWQVNATEAKVPVRALLRGAIHAYIARVRAATKDLELAKAAKEKILLDAATFNNQALGQRGRYLIRTVDGRLIKIMSTRKAYTFAAKHGYYVEDTALQSIERTT